MLPDSFSQATYRAENENEEFDSKHVTISIDEWESVSHDQILAHSFHIGGKRLQNTWFISEPPSWSIYTCAQVAQHPLKGGSLHLALYGQKQGVDLVNNKAMELVKVYRKLR